MGALLFGRGSIADRVPVQAVFNVTGCAADLGRTARATFVVALCVALLLVAMSVLTRARAEVSTSCLPSSIKAALAKANAACGIRVISTFRRGARIAGTRRVSMHASCRAADFTSRDYGCVYRALASWPGKMSIDAGRAKHVHIDDGRYARFEHGRAHRYAKRTKHLRVAHRHRRGPSTRVAAPAGDRG